MQGISFFAHPHFAQLTLDNDDFGCLHVVMCRLRAGSEGGNSLKFLHRKYRLKRAVFSCTNSTELLFSGQIVVVLNN